MESPLLYGIQSISSLRTNIKIHRNINISGDDKEGSEYMIIKRYMIINKINQYIPSYISEKDYILSTGL